MSKGQVRKDALGDYAIYDVERDKYNWIYPEYLYGSAEHIIRLLNSSPRGSKMFRGAEIVFEGTLEECVGHLRMLRILELDDW